MEPKVTEFLKDLKMLVEADWAELPEKYKEDIENWLNNQEGDWSGIEDTGWLTLRDNYLAELIDKFITQIDEAKAEVLERMTDGQKGN